MDERSEFRQAAERLASLMADAVRIEETVGLPSASFQVVLPLVCEVRSRHWYDWQQTVKALRRCVAATDLAVRWELARLLDHIDDWREYWDRFGAQAGLNTRAEEHAKELRRLAREGLAPERSSRWREGYIPLTLAVERYPQWRKSTLHDYCVKDVIDSHKDEVTGELMVLESAVKEGKPKRRGRPARR